MEWRSALSSDAGVRCSHSFCRGRRSVRQPGSMDRRPCRGASLQLSPVWQLLQLLVRCWRLPWLSSSLQRGLSR